MSDGNFKTTWSILLDAGHHSLRALPVSIPLPLPLDQTDSLGPPMLLREGRQRPIPCQWNRTGDEIRAVWLIDSMRRGEKSLYRLSIGERKRQSPARMHIEKSPAGWTVFDEELRIADYLVPERGTPRMTLYGPTGQFAVMQHLAMPRWLDKGLPARGTIEGERSLLRVQSSTMKSTSGPVFSALSTEFDYVDPLDRKIVAESTLIRFHSAERGIRVIDLSVIWKAVAEGLTLIDPQPEAYQRLPVLRVKMSAPIGEEMTSDAGRRGKAEVIDHIAGGIQIQQGGAKLGILARASTVGFPPIWELGDDSTLSIVPRLVDARWLRSPIRLALGESWSLSYRFVVSPAVAEAADDLTSFDIEPNMSICADESNPR